MDDGFEDDRLIHSFIQIDDFYSKRKMKKKLNIKKISGLQKIQDGGVKNENKSKSLHSFHSR